MMTNQETDSLQPFIERMGIVFQTDGLPRIAGRLMGLMVSEGGAFSFSELADRLEVSRASISTNTRLLERMGILERVSKSGDRQDYFQLAKEPYVKLLQGLVFRMRSTYDFVEDAQNKSSGDHHQRLGELKEFYQGMIKAYGGLIDDMSNKRKGA